MYLCIHRRLQLHPCQGRLRRLLGVWEGGRLVEAVGEGACWRRGEGEVAVVREVVVVVAAHSWQGRLLGVW